MVGQPVTLTISWTIDGLPQSASVSNFTDLYRTVEFVDSTGLTVYQLIGMPQQSQIIITMSGSVDPTFGMVFAYQPTIQ